MNQSIESLLINPFGNGIVVDKKPEAVEHVEVTIDKAVERTMQQYDSLNNFEMFIEISAEIERLDMEVLAPSQIQLVLTNISTSADFIYGEFISKLIQTSYDAGNNNFIFNMGDNQSNLRALKGRENNPLHATIIGNVSDYFGIQSEHCIFDIQGDAMKQLGCNSKNSIYYVLGNTGQSCGYESKDCTYIITGNAGCLCGENSKDCTYDIIGNAWSYCGYNSQKCKYNIKGKVSDLIGLIENSAFKVMDEESYRMMAKKFPDHREIIKITDSQGIMMEKKK